LDSHGADAYLVVVPYYNNPTQEGQYQYFKAIAESVDKPIVIYNVPGRTGANMAAETALRLAEIPNIIGTKEASSNYAQISAVIRNAPEGFSVLSGNDDETLSIIATGGHGVISVASNIAPALVSEMTRSALSGDFVRARELHHRLTPLFKNCFVESNPIPVKAGMAAMGLIQNELRLPLIKATDATFSLMERTVRDLGLL
ncbi:MAG: 4-hydroxy-tetrahydrodipicolinate synthase, partial [Candidatus Cryptobacteroides sp.]